VSGSFLENCEGTSQGLNPDAPPIRHVVVGCGGGRRRRARGTCRRRCRCSTALIGLSNLCACPHSNDSNRHAAQQYHLLFQYDKSKLILSHGDGAAQRVVPHAVVPRRTSEFFCKKGIAAYEQRATRLD
jgi:hypothetical protein